MAVPRSAVMLLRASRDHASPSAAAPCAGSERAAPVGGKTRVIAREVRVKRTMRHCGQASRSGGGASRDRTGDLLVANQTLSQLSYGPSLRILGGSGRSCTSDLTLIRGAL